MKYPSGWIIAFASALLSASDANAGKFKFGEEEQLHTIQRIGTTVYNLAHKTTIYFIGAGVYITDDGYVLQKVTDEKSYVPLTDEKLQMFQQNGTLPTPLPPYSIPIWDYLLGYSLWLIIAAIIVTSLFQKVRAKRMNESHLSPPKSPD